MPTDVGAEARYSFGMSADEDGLLLQAIKTWGEGETLREERLTLGSYGAYEELAMDAAELEMVRQQEGLGAAMHVAEALAVASGYLDRDRDDPRLFTEGPPDPFQTARAREIGPEGAAWFEAAFASGEKALLQPVDDTVNYAIVVQYADAYTVELAAEKYWRGEDGNLDIESVTLHTYEPEPENQNEVAAMDREHLLRTHAEHGLGRMMEEAWHMGVKHEHLNPDDPQLFTRGPADAFERGVEHGMRSPAAREGDLDDTQEMGVISPDTHDDGAWRADVLPLNVFDTDGEPLGASAVVVNYPKQGLVAYDPDERIQAQYAQVLEIGQFHTWEDAEGFADDFLDLAERQDGRDVLELAESVAEQQDVPVIWRDVGGAAVSDLQSGTFSIVHERDDWNPRQYTPTPHLGPDLDL